MDFGMINLGEHHLSKKMDGVIRLIDESGYAYHLSGYHVYINYDFSHEANPAPLYQPTPMMKSDSDSVIKQNHHVHLFYKKIVPCMTDGRLSRFIERCYQTTGNKVIIHVPRINRPLNAKVLIVKMNQTYPNEMCKIISEKETVIWNFHPKTNMFIRISWKGQGNRIIANLLIGGDKNEQTES